MSSAAYVLLAFVAILVAGWIGFGFWLRYATSKARFAFKALIFATSTFALASANYFYDPVELVTTLMHSISANIPIIKTSISTTGFLFIILFIVFFMWWAERIFRSWPDSQSTSVADAFLDQKQLGFLEAYKALRYERTSVKPALKNETTLDGDDPPGAPQAGSFQKSWVESIRFLVVDKFHLASAVTVFSAIRNSYREQERDIEIFLFETRDQLTALHKKRITDWITESSAARPLYAAYGIVRAGLNISDTSDIPLKIFAETELFEPLVSMSSYVASLRRYLDRRPAPETATIRELIVDVPCATKYQAYESTQKFIQGWMRSANQTNLVALTGDYGQGKTTALLMASLDLLENDQSASCIPIYIRLSGVDLVARSTNALLAEWMADHRVDTVLLTYILNSGRAVLILDGFDEIDLRNNSARVVPAFDKLYSLTEQYPLRIILSGRPKFFNTVQERLIALREQKAETISAQLSRLSVAAIESLFEKIAPDQLADFKRFLVESNGRVLDLINRPIILTQVALIWSEIQQEIRANRLFSSVVIRHFIDYIYRREYHGAETKTATSFLSEGEVRLITYAVASLMGNRNSIADSEVVDLITAVVPKIEKQVTVAYGYNDLHEVNPIANRYHDPEKSRLHFMRDFITRGLLERDIVDSNKIHFSHKSFSDYLRGEVLLFNLIGHAADQQTSKLLSSRALYQYQVRREIPSRDELNFAADILAEAIRKELTNQNAHSLSDKLSLRRGGRGKWNSMMTAVVMNRLLRLRSRSDPSRLRFGEHSRPGKIVRYLLKLYGINPSTVTDYELLSTLLFLAAGRNQAPVAIFERPELRHIAKDYGYAENTSDEQKLTSAQFRSKGRDEANWREIVMPFSMFPHRFAEAALFGCLQRVLLDPISF